MALAGPLRGGVSSSDYWDVATAEDVKSTKEESGGAGYRGKPVPEGTPGAAVRLRVPDED